MPIRKKPPTIDQLFAEMLGLVKSAPPPPPPKRSANARGAKQRLVKLKKALATRDPLPRIRALLPDDGSEKQNVVVYAFACLLETASAGLPILLDRFDDQELDKIAKALKTIGATRSRAQLLRLRGGRPPKRDSSETDALVDEIETKLLAFCRTHVADLAEPG